MIYPRLRLAKDLLTEDGVIFISIDSRESSISEKFAMKFLVQLALYVMPFGGLLIIATMMQSNSLMIIIPRSYIVVLHLATSKTR